MNWLQFTLIKNDNSDTRLTCTKLVSPEFLEESINNFIKENNIDIIDIKFNSSCSIYGEEQIYCFSALIMYESNNKE